MAFLKPKSTIQITLGVDEATAKRVAPSVTTILNNLSPDEIELLARAVANPIIKTMALAELKKIL